MFSLPRRCRRRAQELRGRKSRAEQRENGEGRSAIDRWKRAIKSAARPLAKHSLFSSSPFLCRPPLFFYLVFPPTKIMDAAQRRMASLAAHVAAPRVRVSSERASEGVEELTERRERHLSAAMTAGIKKFSCLHIRFGLCSKASFRHSLALFTALDTRETCIVDGRREINDKQSIAAVLLKLTNFIMKKKTRKKNRPTPPSSPPPRPLLLRLQASRSRSWAPEEASASPSACF